MRFSTICLVLFALPFFIGCDKTIECEFPHDDKEVYKGDKEEYFCGVLETECLEMIYPYSWSLPDGTTLTLESEEDDSLKSWYEAHPDTEEKPEVIYPVEVISFDELLIIEDEAAMIALKDECEEKEG